VWWGRPAVHRYCRLPPGPPGPQALLREGSALGVGEAKTAIRERNARVPRRSLPFGTIGIWQLAVFWSTRSARSRLACRTDSHVVKMGMAARC
jgi:hypothetical protein